AISELLGFSSPGYFSKTFKRITGMSPQEYQRSLNRLLG
ncbi:MAG: AraC family transcriptional regulator, partial [Clostridia bacterium]|nr:AraC family transcriptional regulator [Clostridia bacterium]